MAHPRIDGRGRIACGLPTLAEPHPFCTAATYTSTMARKRPRERDIVRELQEDAKVGLVDELDRAMAGSPARLCPS